MQVLTVRQVGQLSSIEFLDESMGLLGVEVGRHVPGLAHTLVRALLQVPQTPGFVLPGRIAL